MAHEQNGASRREKVGSARRLIAGLRITPQDEALLDVVRTFFPETDSEGELAYRLWRRGLEVTLAEAAGVGASLPAGATEQNIARLVVQRLLLCLPLLRRTGLLTLLGLELTHQNAESELNARSFSGDAEEPVDDQAAAAIASLGGNEFL